MLVSLSLVIDLLHDTCLPCAVFMWMVENHDLLQDTCLPCAVFVWTVENHGTELLDVSIVLTFKNGQGDSHGDDTAGGVWNQLFRSVSNETCLPMAASSDVISGVLIHQMFGGMQCTYGVGSRHSVSIDLAVILTALFLL